MKFHIYKDGAGEFRWRLRARNGRILADSGEGYQKRGHCLRMIRKIVQASMAEDMEIVDETVKRAA